MKRVKKNYFIFIHTLNKPYKENCAIPEKSKLDFHKSINGRLELNYRFSLAIKQALNKKSTGNIISEKLLYLNESYLKTDKFYIIPGKTFDKKKNQKNEKEYEEERAIFRRLLQRGYRILFSYSN